MSEGRSRWRPWVWMACALYFAIQVTALTLNAIEGSASLVFLSAALILMGVGNILILRSRQEAKVDGRQGRD